MALADRPLALGDPEIPDPAADRLSLSVPVAEVEPDDGSDGAVATSGTAHRHNAGAPPEDDWSPWHPGELARRLDAVARPWCVVGGWALDLWHGHQTRDHEDLEFTVLRDDVGVFRQALSDMTLYTVADGRFEILPEGAEPPPHILQIWCFDARAARWRVDLMIEPGEPDAWVCRRCPAIRHPRAGMVASTPEGIPYLRPAAVLLFKAKHRRDKDEADFERALPHLTPAERRWLREGLDRLHPGHAWAQAL
ncbi:amino acid transporter [Methylobacterium sp. AMS5]|uniref:nucleotidyltransferase domain-containing protein n=1 Tax=Methylobacterium sp. AMS5 TaxID=925818 RepID=UPI00074F901E|nr:amino acid transporter [Methylobacterium sp. AMS5]AMB46825.1 amino acid transporter [Methylobacterium sp. AMS5]